MRTWIVFNNVKTKHNVWISYMCAHVWGAPNARSGWCHTSLFHGTHLRTNVCVCGDGGRRGEMGKVGGREGFSSISWLHSPTLLCFALYGCHLGSPNAPTTLFSFLSFPSTESFNQSPITSS